MCFLNPIDDVLSQHQHQYQHQHQTVVGEHKPESTRKTNAAESMIDSSKQMEALHKRRKLHGELLVTIAARISGGALRW